MDEKELINLAKSIKPEKKEYDILQSTFSVSLEKFWDLFYSDDASFSFKHFHIIQKQKDIKVSNWEEDKAESKEEDDDITTFKRNFNMKVAIKGVPFCSSSKCLRESIVTKSPTKIEFESKVQTPDVPYGNYFYLKERWIVGSIDPQGDKVYLRVFISINMVKSTIFKSKIESR